MTGKQLTNLLHPGFGVPTDFGVVIKYLLNQSAHARKFKGPVGHIGQGRGIRDQPAPQYRNLTFEIDQPVPIPTAGGIDHPRG